MATTKQIAQIDVNGTVYTVGGDSPFTLTEKNGAQMSACTSTGQYAVAEGLSTTASGDYSHAEGFGVTADGDYSHAEGCRTTASNVYDHAEGWGSTASGSCSHAEGNGTTASGWASHSEGNNTTASGYYSHAEGSQTSSTTYGSHAEGNSTTASGQTSHAEGAYTIAGADYSHAEGNSTKASGQSSHAEGNHTSATSLSSHAEGGYTSASGSCSHAEGSYTVASGAYSHAEGFGTSATTVSEHASGYNNISLNGSSEFGDSGNTLFTVGNGHDDNYHNAIDIRQNGDIYIANTNASGEYYEKPMIKLQDALANVGNGGNGGTNDDSPFTLTSNNGATMSKCTSTGAYAVAEGSGTTASGGYSHAEGYGAIANGWASHSEGNGTKTSGTCAHAEGASTTASGDLGSHAEGNGTKASGTSSHAEGQNTTASGSYSHAEGYNTSATSQSSHAEGENAKAGGNSSHAEGHRTTADGFASHAEGNNTTATGDCSHAEGSGTTASSRFSHAEGYYTSTTTQSEHASGQYNKSLNGSSTFGGSDNTLFTVGNGLNANNTHNAFQIMQNGDIYIADTSTTGQYYNKPMIKLQEALANAGGDDAKTFDGNSISEFIVYKDTGTADEMDGCTIRAYNDFPSTYDKSYVLTIGKEGGAHVQLMIPYLSMFNAGMHYRDNVYGDGGVQDTFGDWVNIVDENNVESYVKKHAPQYKEVKDNTFNIDNEFNGMARIQFTGAKGQFPTNSEYQSLFSISAKNGNSQILNDANNGRWFARNQVYGQGVNYTQWTEFAFKEKKIDVRSSSGKVWLTAKKENGGKQDYIFDMSIITLSGDCTSVDFNNGINFYPPVGYDYKVIFKSDGTDRNVTLPVSNVFKSYTGEALKFKVPANGFAEVSLIYDGTYVYMKLNTPMISQD